MVNYKLYQLGSTNEEVVFESSSLGDAILTAISLSEEQKESNTYDTFKLVTYIDYERRYGCRYFEKGEEITGRIIRETLDQIVG